MLTVLDVGELKARHQHLPRAFSLLYNIVNSITWWEWETVSSGLHYSSYKDNNPIMGTPIWWSHLTLINFQGPSSKYHKHMDLRIKFPTHEFRRTYLNHRRLFISLCLFCKIRYHIWRTRYCFGPELATEAPIDEA